ncbi:multidrug effflux MFS transporter [Moritella sp. 24]|uniref:multidrug effflux MFS transporter n=1 Tax=Moritella sp. 24 TaxID=2746230 RepID=UPI001BA78FF2|nr:multidrug effflux MFS transporter [Moritella sp. 24]QUM75449.1 multidrug effflux MFS transporter [Moritella sp. 24]
MNKKPHIGLILALMMFPQIVETIYSPVLPHLARSFDISVNTAAQTLSIYFSAFAVGVIFWGRIADLIGRRTTMLIGLCTYGLGSILALTATDFNMIMVARFMSAFGAAVGSVVTQTMLRDSYKGDELVKVFTLMGMGISLSPVIGLISGGIIADLSGYVGVFSVLLILAIILYLVALNALPETRPDNIAKVSLLTLLVRMLKDSRIRYNAMLVALFNLVLFSYYSLAPFIFSHFGFSSIEFGYTGIALACGSLLGSLLNKRLLQTKCTSQSLLRLACGLVLLGSSGVYMTQDSVWLLVPMLIVVMSYGIAIPNILAHALTHYKDVAGSAGAVFGLMYYLLLGAGLAITGLLNNLGLVLILAAIIIFGCTYQLNTSKPAKQH